MVQTAAEQLPYQSHLTALTPNGTVCQFVQATTYLAAGIVPASVSLQVGARYTFTSWNVVQNTSSYTAYIPAHKNAT